MNLRRPEFEKAYAEAHDMRVEDFAQYRMGETYRLPMIAKCWRFWQMARVLEYIAGRAAMAKEANRD